MAPSWSVISPSIEPTPLIFSRLTCASLLDPKKSYSKAGCSRSRHGVRHGAGYILRCNESGKTGSHGRQGAVLRPPLKLRTPRNFQTPGSFDYAGYLARRGLYLTAFVWDDRKIEKIEPANKPGTWLRPRLEPIRRTVGAFFDAHLSAPPSAILRALIIGDKSRLAPELRDSFTRVDVAHVLAISGLHIGLVATLAYGAWW